MRAARSVTDFSYSALFDWSSAVLQLSSDSIAERNPRKERSMPEKYTAHPRAKTATIKNVIFFIIKKLSDEEGITKY